MNRTLMRSGPLAAALLCVAAHLAAAAPVAGVTVAGGTPIGFNAGAGLSALTNGVIDDDDWLTEPRTSLGWLDSGWNINPALSVDTGVPQPQLTFNLGGTYLLNSVTVHYVVDQIAGDDTRNLRAPDSMTASFSVLGSGGPFFGSVTQTAWDDSPETNATGGIGDARSVTTPLGVVANAVRLDFLTNAEWLFMSEITFDGQAIPEPTTGALLVSACGLFAGLRKRRSYSA